VCLKLKISGEVSTPSEGFSCVVISPEAYYFSVNGTYVGLIVSLKQRKSKKKYVSRAVEEY
jgi:hypothetical protein